MSCFIDKLKQASQAMPPPMGFRAAQTVSKPRMLLVASLPQASVDNLADLVAGADAGLLPMAKLGSGIKTLEETVQAVPDIPWGAWLDSINQQGIKQVEKAGGDFLLFPAAKMSLAILGIEKVGKILAVEASLDEGLLKAINELPADAVFVTSHQKGGYCLTWHHLMIFKRLADLLIKPLLVPVPSNVATNELQVLWEAGVDGVVVEATPGQPGGFKKLRQMIDSLTLPSKRKRMKARALLPQIREEASPIIEEEEEE